jgi:hypothetical protein
MIEIVYPERRQLHAEVIERLFLAAVQELQIPPEQLSAKTPQEMAAALENIGWIHLAKRDTTKTTEDQKCASS